MTEDWKEWAIGALLFALTVVASWGVTRAHEQDERVRAEVSAARQQLCGALYASGKCPMITSGAKTRVVRGAVFAGADKKSLHQLAPLLEKYGWVQADSDEPARTVFCRGAYGADYLEYENYSTVNFFTDEPVCLKRFRISG